MYGCIQPVGLTVEWEDVRLITAGLLNPGSNIHSWCMTNRVNFVWTDQLERVFLRLGHAETDEQLQDVISKFLPPVLLKLSSVQEGVRKKVRRIAAYLCALNISFR